MRETALFIYVVFSAFLHHWRGKNASASDLFMHLYTFGWRNVLQTVIDPFDHVFC